MKGKTLSAFLAATILVTSVSCRYQFGSGHNHASADVPESSGVAETPVSAEQESPNKNYTDLNALFQKMDESPKVDFTSVDICAHSGYTRKECEQSGARAHEPASKNPLAARPNYPEKRCEEIHGVCDEVMIDRGRRYQPHVIAGWVVTANAGHLDVEQSAPLYPMIRDKYGASPGKIRADGERYYDP